MTVVERSAGLAREGFSITIPANGTRALDAMGVLSDVRDASVTLTRFDYLWNDELIVSAPLDRGFDSWPWLALLRTDLLGALAKKAGDVVYGVSLEQIEEDIDGVSVAFTDGASDRFDLVVGADGASSTVRSLMPARDAAESAGFLYYRFVVQDSDHPPVLRGYLGDGCLFGIFAGGPGRVYGWGAVATPGHQIDAVEGRRQRLLDRFAGLGREPCLLLERTSSDHDFSCTSPTWVRAKQWHTDRVVLIGDAAHACPPFMAEGACLAMEDSLVLSSCLVSASWPPREALAAYQDRRSPRSAFVHRVVDVAASSITTASAASERVDRLRSAGPEGIAAQIRPLLEPL